MEWTVSSLVYITSSTSERIEAGELCYKSWLTWAALKRASIPAFYPPGTDSARERGLSRQPLPRPGPGPGPGTNWPVMSPHPVQVEEGQVNIAYQDEMSIALLTAQSRLMDQADPFFCSTIEDNEYRGMMDGKTQRVATAAAAAMLELGSLSDPFLTFMTSLYLLLFDP